MESSLSKDSASTATTGSGYEVFQAPFASVLSKRGYKSSTIGVYLATLRRVARLLEREGGCLAMLQRADVPGLLRRLLGKRRDPPLLSNLQFTVAYVAGDPRALRPC